MNEARCEPPEELRGVDGWHWVQAPVGEPHLARWHAAERDDVEPLWTSTHHVYSGTPRYAVREWGWRYVAPVTPPAIVTALVDALQYLQAFPEATEAQATARAALSLYRAGTPPDTTKRYATPMQAAADMARLSDGPGALSPLHLHLRAVVGDPRASSDHLLLLADALRSEAHTTGLTIPAYAQQLTAWANTLTDLAPSRANPIEAT